MGCVNRLLRYRDGALLVDFRFCGEGVARAPCLSPAVAYKRDVCRHDVCASKPGREIAGCCVSKMDRRLLIVVWAALALQIPFELRNTWAGLSNLQWTFLALAALNIPS